MVSANVLSSSFLYWYDSSNHYVRIPQTKRRFRHSISDNAALRPSHRGVQVRSMQLNSVCQDIQSLCQRTLNWRRATSAVWFVAYEYNKKKNTTTTKQWFILIANFRPKVLLFFDPGASKIRKKHINAKGREKPKVLYAIRKFVFKPLLNPKCFRTFMRARQASNYTMYFYVVL